MSRTRNTDHLEAGSAFWMARVVRAAQALSEMQALVKAGIAAPWELEVARDNYRKARLAYTNPFGVEKTVTA